MKNINNERGAVSGLLVSTIVLLLFVIGFGSFSIWAYLNYQDQKNNVDTKIASAVEVAKEEQKDVDEASFLEREKEPYRSFSGPSDFGSVRFDYPKTWSAYLDETGPSTYEAYLSPGVLQPVNAERPYALRITILSRTYERVLDSYESKIKKGELTSKPITINGQQGNRLDGVFSDEAEGSMVVFKLRDKTLQAYTEEVSFRKDFDNVILKTLTFNP